MAQALAARGYRLVLADRHAPPDAVRAALGNDIGFTQDQDNSLVVVNFGGDAVSNTEFLAKAPEDVVEGQKARKAEVEEQIKKMKDNLKEIGV